MKKSKIKCIVILCIIVILIFAIVFVRNYNRDGKWIVKKVKVDSNSVNDASARIVSWENQTISEQYPLVYYDIGKYISRKSKMSNNIIEEKLEENTVSSVDGEHIINIEIYSIKNISKKCAISVKFENDNDYYVYVNQNYIPSTLGEFLKDINFENTITFGTVNYDYIDEKSDEYKHIEFYDVDRNIILQKVFGNASIENVDRNQVDISNASTPSIVINFSSKELGYENQAITITDKGYILTNILDTDKTFYLGEEKMQEFLDYVIDNYQGYKIVYEDERDNDISSTVMYDLSSNTTTNLKNNDGNNKGNSNTEAYSPISN